MAALCGAIEERLSGILCSVIAVDHGGLLHPVAGPSIPAELCALVDGMPIRPMAGSCVLRSISTGLSAAPTSPPIRAGPWREGSTWAIAWRPAGLPRSRMGRVVCWRRILFIPKARADCGREADRQHVPASVLDSVERTSAARS